MQVNKRIVALKRRLVEAEQNSRSTKRAEEANSKADEAEV